jgi:hypothetical protein
MLRRLAAGIVAVLLTTVALVVGIGVVYSDVEFTKLPAVVVASCTVHYSGGIHGGGGTYNRIKWRIEVDGRNYTQEDELFAEHHAVNETIEVCAVHWSGEYMGSEMDCSGIFVFWGLFFGIVFIALIFALVVLIHEFISQWYTKKTRFIELN